MGRRSAGRTCLRRDGRLAPGSPARSRWPRRSRSPGASIRTTGATGYASEAALASLRHGFDVVGLDEIVALTTTRNHRSQAVMVRIGMRRDIDGDFDHPSLPEGSPLRCHVLYRIQPSQLPPTVAA